MCSLVAGHAPKPPGIEVKESIMQSVLLSLSYWSFNNIKVVWRYPEKICLNLLDQTFEQLYDEKTRNWQTAGWFDTVFSLL